MPISYILSIFRKFKFLDEEKYTPYHHHPLHPPSFRTVMATTPSTPKDRHANNQGR